MVALVVLGIVMVVWSILLAVGIRATRAVLREKKAMRDELAAAQKNYEEGNRRYRDWKGRTCDALVEVHNGYIRGAQRPYAAPLKPIIEDINGGQVPGGRLGRTVLDEARAALEARDAQGLADPTSPEGAARAALARSLEDAMREEDAAYEAYERAGDAWRAALAESRALVEGALSAITGFTVPAPRGEA
mgnify:CR=1 FL=1